MKDDAMGLYVVRDRVAEINSPVFEQPNDAAAERVFNLKTLKEAGESAGDFELYAVGHRVGMMVTAFEPRLLAKGEDYATQRN